MGTPLACTAGEKGTPKAAGIAHFTRQPNFQHQYNSDRERSGSQDSRWRNNFTWICTYSSTDVKCFKTTIWGPNFRRKYVQTEVVQDAGSPYRQDRQMEVIVSLTDMEKWGTVRVSSLCLQKRCAAEMGAQQPRPSVSHLFHGIFALFRHRDVRSHQWSPEWDPSSGPASIPAGSCSAPPQRGARWVKLNTEGL